MINIGHTGHGWSHSLGVKLSYFYDYLAVIHPRTHCVPHHHLLCRLNCQAIDFDVASTHGLSSRGTSLK